jgi:hypothetical protein
MLRTLDAERVGANQREIAQGLVGPVIVERDWRAGTDYLRLRVQRLVRASVAILSGDYLGLVGGGKSPKWRRKKQQL